MSDDKRECIVSDYGKQEKGMFVKYAPIQFYDEANHPYTAEKAIVELDSGQVVTVDPQCVRFKPKNSN